MPLGPVVELRGLQKRFGTHQAVGGFSLSVAPKQCVCLLGPSGCGKTTTLRMIAGLETPDSGQILIDGADVTRLPPYLRNVGLVFQDYALFPHLTVAENIAFGLKHRNAPKAEIPDRIAAVLTLVRLTGLERRKPAQLSGGQQQRVALARALATRPTVLLLDEPLSNLDAKLRGELRTQIREILDQASITTILVTHDQDEAMGLADRIVVMDSGRIEQIGRPDEIYDRPQTRFVAEFVGRSNWLRGRMLSLDDNGIAAFSLDTGESVLVAEAQHAALSIGDACDLCIRPERLFVVSGADRQSQEGDLNVLSGRLRRAEMLGPQLHLHMTLDAGGDMLAIVPRLREDPPSEGTKILLGFRRSDVLLMPSHAR